MVSVHRWRSLAPLLLAALVLPAFAATEITEDECARCARFAAETGLQKNGTFSSPCTANPMHPDCSGGTTPALRWVDRCTRIGGRPAAACEEEFQETRRRCARVLRSATYYQFEARSQAPEEDRPAAPQEEATEEPRSLSDVLASLRSRNGGGTVREVQDPVCREGLEGDGQEITELWPALERLPRIDAAVRTARPHEVAVFGGDQVVFLDTRTGEARRSGKIAALWPGPFTEDIDAALNWTSKGSVGKVYLFRDGLYARYDFFRGTPMVDVNYPRGTTRSWSGLPGDLDSGFLVSGSTAVFFRQEKAYTYDLEKSRWSQAPILENFLGAYPTRIEAAVRPERSGPSFFFRDGRAKRFAHDREVDGCAEN